MLRCHMSDPYIELWRQRAEAFARSTRETKYNIAVCMLAGWTEEEITRWIDTGIQPAGKECFETAT